MNKDLKYNHIFDYSPITDNIYIGSDLCQGGVCKIHGEEFKKLKVTAEINLKLEDNELPPKEIKAYTWLPVSDQAAPSSMQFDIGSVVINETVKAGEVIYIHCKDGHGRAPTIVAAYLIRFQKMTAGEAIDFIKSKRPEIHVEDIQVKALEEFMAKYH